MANSKDLLVKVYGDNYENHFKSANYLFVAHGGGFVGCLTLLKDYATTKEYQGVGFFIVLFGLGILVTTIHYIALAFSRGIVMKEVLDEEEPDDGLRRFLTHMNWIPLAASLLLLLIAIFGLMIKFARL